MKITARLTTYLVMLVILVGVCGGGYIAGGISSMLFGLGIVSIVFGVVGLMNYFGGYSTKEVAVFTAVFLILGVGIFGSDVNGWISSWNTLQSEATTYYNAHTFTYQGSVTYTKQWQSKDCSFFNCWDIANENVTISVSNGHQLSESYTCNYFTLGQSVSVRVTPVMGIFELSDNGTFGYESHTFSYAVLGVPSGC